MKMFLVGLAVMAGFAGSAQAELFGRCCTTQSTQRIQSTPSTQYSWESGNAYFFDSNGRQISAAEHDRQLKAYRDYYYGTGNTSTYSTRNNYGTSYGTENNYGTSYKTINNYGNSHTTVNNYGNGRTTVNDYGAGSVTTYNNRTSSHDETMRKLDEIIRRLEARR